MGGRLAITMACLYPDYVHSLLLENCTAGFENEADRKERREKMIDLPIKLSEKT